MKVLVGALALSLVVSAVPTDNHPWAGIAAVTALQAGFVWLMCRAMNRP